MKDLVEIKLEKHLSSLRRAHLTYRKAEVEFKAPHKPGVVGYTSIWEVSMVDQKFKTILSYHFLSKFEAGPGIYETQIRQENYEVKVNLGSTVSPRLA